ncbi:MAG: DUF6240 domain-containing protein, partial [Vallitaleaceae bacterium]|nr:DUF6240 domain-containing protein [Vallitaleaceae bacterium]
YDRIMNLSENQILNVLRNQKAFNIDQANNASCLPEQSVQVTSDVEKLDTQIKKILEQNNIEPRTETIGIVKKAIASNIPLDENTLLKLRTLIGSSGDGLQSSTDSNGRMAQHVIGEAQKSVANDAEKLHALIKRAAENILHKIPTAQIKLPLKITSRATAPKEVVEQLVKNVNTFKDQQIVSVINNDKVMNIKNLVEAMADMNSKNQNDATQTITSEGQGARISLDEKLTSISMVIDRLMKDTNNFKLDQSVEMTVDTLNTNAKTMVSETGELQFIKSTICIEELRLKMTYEAASRLYEKGIDVATKPIEDVVEHLKVLELEQYASALKVHQVTETEGNLRQMETTMTAVTRLSYTSTQVKFRVLAGEESFTLEAITREQSMTLVAKEAMSRYDIMGTEVRPDLGDRIERTYDQIGPILKELGLEVSDENTRIVKALAANEMALTVENIESLKAIDLKLSQITDTLRPTIVASMIGDGINPMGMDIDEMLEYMKGYSDAFLNTESEQLAEAILDLKNENTLSEDEKSSLIGIYRMLRTIAGSKGQAASFLVKKQLPLNLKNLFEAAKYMQTTKGKREQIKATIDDDFGLLDRVNYKGDKISEQIKTALKDNHMASTQTNAALLENMSEQQVNLTSKNILEATNHQLKLDQFFSSFSHQKMMALDQEGILKDYEKPLEDLTHELKAIKDGGKVETKEILNRLADLVKMDIQSLKTFEKYGLKSTTAQLLTHFTLKENPHEFSEVLNRMFENMSKEGVDTSSLRGQLNKLSEGNLGQKQLELLEEVKPEINQLRDTGTNKGYSQGEQMQRDFGSSNQLIEYQQRLFQNEDYYQIPVWMDDQWVQLNLYYQNHGSEADSKPEDEMDIYLFFETKNLGQVQSHMHLKERHMQFSIYAEQKEDQALLKNYGEQITEIISSSVFELDGISYDHFEAKSPIDEGLDAPTINAIKYVDSKFVAVG